MKATETTQVFDGVTRKYREVEIGEHCYTEKGENLIRIETKGRTGTTFYVRLNYIYNGVEQPVYGMGGSTGHGWGGRIIGYVTREEAEANEKIRF